MGKSSKAPAPDPQIGQAAVMQAQLGNEWLSLAKDQFAISNARQVGIDDMARRVSQSQLDAQEQASGWAREDRDRWRTVYKPLQDQFIQKAQGWDSAERQAKVAAEAKADVMGAAAQAEEQRTRTMAAQGVDPTSGRYAGVERAADAVTSLAAAGAQNNARNQVRKEAMALQGDAINMGNGLPGQASSALGLGVGAGTSALGSTIAANTARTQSMGILSSGYQGAMQGYQNMGSLLNTQYQNQLQSWQANQNANNASMSGIMQGLGSAAGLFMMSDEEKKEHKRPARGVLEAVRKMPVEQWKYKDGVADEGEHIGPYAQDFKEATGKGDGKTINVVDAIGVTMGAVQELAEKVDKIERAVTDDAREDGGERDEKPVARGVIPAARRTANARERGLNRRAA